MRIPSRGLARTTLLLGLLTALSGCSGRARITSPIVPVGGGFAFVFTTDYASGALSVIEVTTRQASVNVAPTGAVHSDATLRTHGGRLYVVNRYPLDNVHVLDAKTFTTLIEFTTGNGTNPQDIAFASSSKAYVTRYASADLLVVDPRTGATITTIPLGAFADADGIPEMAAMAYVAPYLFVACQRLTNFQPVNASVVVVIDTRSDKVVDAVPLAPGIQPITLTGRNPFTDFIFDPIERRLFIGCAGAFGVLDGGVEIVDPIHLASDGFAITESALGGDVNDMAWNGETHSYAIVSDASFNASVVAWNAVTGDTLRTVYAPGGFTLADAEVRGDALWVADASFTTPGVRIYHAGPDTLRAGPLDVGLPPRKIAF